MGTSRSSTYQPAETSVTLAAKKAYVKSDSTPAALKGGEFAFDLYEGDLTAEQLKGGANFREGTGWSSKAAIRLGRFSRRSVSIASLRCCTHRRMLRRITR